MRRFNPCACLPATAPRWRRPNSAPLALARCRVLNPHGRVVNERLGMEPQEDGEEAFQSLAQVSLADLARAHTAATAPPSSSSGGADSGLGGLAEEELLRVAGASWSLEPTAGGTAAAPHRSARALALASRTSRQHLVLMKRITLCVPRNACADLCATFLTTSPHADSRLTTASCLTATLSPPTGSTP